VEHLAILTTPVHLYGVVLGLKGQLSSLILEEEENRKMQGRIRSKNSKKEEETKQEKIYNVKKSERM
jgi:hypothetical protein